MDWSHGDWGWGPGLVMVALSVAFWLFVRRGRSASGTLVGRT